MPPPPTTPPPPPIWRGRACGTDRVVCCKADYALSGSPLPPYRRTDRPTDRPTNTLPSPESAVSSSSALKFPPKRCTSGSLSERERAITAQCRQHIYDYHRPEALHFPITDFVCSSFPLFLYRERERGMPDMRHSYRRAIGIPFSIVFKAFNEYFSRLRQFGRGAREQSDLRSARVRRRRRCRRASCTLHVVHWK